jgi:nitrate/nitrite transport system ATP-binding protein
LARLCGEGDGRVTTVMITNSVEEAILLSDRIVPILPGPPATLGVPIAVALPRPRSAELLAHDDHAARVRTHVIATLTAALSATMRGRQAAASIAAPIADASDVSKMTVAEEAR